MTIRKTEELEVSRTNTERFKKSAGIQIQNTINEMIYYRRKEM